MDSASRLRALASSGTDARTALAFFDELGSVEPDSLLGTWRGSGLHSGHAQDGMLEALGWYGKRFDDAESVHPLLFGERGQYDLDSRWLLLGLTRMAAPGAVLRAVFDAVMPLLTTSAPRARLRRVEHRGVMTAAMVYDYLPIIDIFKRVDDSTVLGLMDQRGVQPPLFFVLQREALIGTRAI